MVKTAKNRKWFNYKQLDKENNCLTKHDAIIFIEDRKELLSLIQ
jgi:hypothetical protein